MVLDSYLNRLIFQNLLFKWRLRLLRVLFYTFLSFILGSIHLCSLSYILNAGSDFSSYIHSFGFERFNEGFIYKSSDQTSPILYLTYTTTLCSIKYFSNNLDSLYRFLRNAPVVWKFDISSIIKKDKTVTLMEEYLKTKDTDSAESFAKYLTEFMPNLINEHIKINTNLLNILS